MCFSIVFHIQDFDDTCLEKLFAARRTGIFGFQITHVGFCLCVDYFQMVIMILSMLSCIPYFVNTIRY